MNGVNGFNLLLFLYQRVHQEPLLIIMIRVGGKDSSRKQQRNSQIEKKFVHV